MNPLKRLQEHGQSVYLDEIRRSWLDDGTLQTLIDRDGLRGVTSNPAIFHKAITQSDDYREAIARLARAGGTVADAYEDIVIEDIQRAADLFAPTHEASGGKYGFVSLEVSPEVADDAEATYREGKHLWQRLGRPNVFIKVPATAPGLDAIQRLIGDGINVNVTLLFGLERYERVIDAYVSGLEERLAAGKSVRGINSVASFFLSRFDVMVDPLLDEIGTDEARSLRGEAAIAYAKVAYEIFSRRFSDTDERWRPLAVAGARVQRLLWASTGTKDPSYPDTKYVEPLIGPETVNTMPLETLDAYRDHGDPATRVTEGLPEAKRVIERLGALGIGLEDVADRLETEGVEKFVKPFRGLMGALEESLAVGKQAVADAIAKD
ncbi:MAG TPA: transaldolase [Trueperaceae bacterium]|nr:transaldolase [Trueperaceae bacterium]